jgi:hypothetical protein
MRQKIGYMQLGPDETDEVMAALQAVVEVLLDNRDRTDRALERADRIREQRLAGRSYTEIAEGSEGPLLVELLSADILALQTVGHRLRTAGARALRSEGLSSARIARLFHVSRQRVTALLQSAPRDDLVEEPSTP